MDELQIIEQLKISNRLKAMELSLKVLELIANPKLSDIKMPVDQQKFLVDIATGQDIPLENFKELLKEPKNSQ